MDCILNNKDLKDDICNICNKKINTCLRELEVEKKQAKNKQIREALVSCAEILEVLGFEIKRKPYKEMTKDFQKLILKKVDIIRDVLK